MTLLDALGPRPGCHKSGLLVCVDCVCKTRESVGISVGSIVHPGVLATKFTCSRRQRIRRVHPGVGLERGLLSACTEANIVSRMSIDVKHPVGMAELFAKLRVTPVIKRQNVCIFLSMRCSYE